MTLLGASCRARAARRGRHGAPGATARSSCGAPEARVSAPAPSCSSLVLDRYILLARPLTVTADLFLDRVQAVRHAKGARSRCA